MGYSSLLRLSLLLMVIIFPAGPTLVNDTSLALPYSEESGREKRQLTLQYYDFLINEWSFKFWAVFQLVTIAVLLYSTFAAIYYAKWTYLKELDSPDYESDFVVRSMEPSTFQRIMDAISSEPAS